MHADVTKLNSSVSKHGDDIRLKSLRHKMQVKEHETEMGAGRTADTVLALPTLTISTDILQLS